MNDFDDRKQGSSVPSSAVANVRLTALRYSTGSSARSCQSVSSLAAYLRWQNSKEPPAKQPLSHVCTLSRTKIHYASMSPQHQRLHRQHQCLQAQDHRVHEAEGIDHVQVDPAASAKAG